MSLKLFIVYKVARKMRYHLYSSSDGKTTTDEFLTYIDYVDIEDKQKENYSIEVVKHILKLILSKRVIPYFIELSLQDFIFKILNASISDNHLEIQDYFEAIMSLLQNEDDLKHLYYIWTEVEQYPLVIVCETDICAPYILKQFPPVERYM